MDDYIFGANILENLTTGMYQDSKVIYREYIQNSCDQIKKAIVQKLVEPKEAHIEIWIDRCNRTIVIEDNATGISANEFKKTLSKIADSNKDMDEDIGFRGIGRLCGLAYCSKLVFTTSAKGEDIISILSCDAIKMRQMIEENEHGLKHTAQDILRAINKFDKKSTKDFNSHFFKVELIGISQENTDLLDTQAVKNYLSFIAPVPYQNTFIFRNKVYEHAAQLNTKIDEYNVFLEGEQIFKKYITDLKDTNGTKYDEIFDIEFRDFYDEDNHLIAWMWYGLTRFSGAIPNSKSNPSNPMRGLRLRKENVQIGGEDALQKLFKEDRGNSYFVGEVFATSKGLIPNSQRDYFNENHIRTIFESVLQLFFNEQLHKIYRIGSEINSAYKRIDTYTKKEAEYNRLYINGSFINEEQRNNASAEVERAKADAQKAKEKIAKKKEKASPEDVIGKVINRIQATHKQSTKITEVNKASTSSKQRAKDKWRTDGEKYSSYSRNERKLISKILGIIALSTDKTIADSIIQKIEEEL